jgi:hypothetical protein
MRLPISTQINIWGQQLKEFDYWLMFADFESHSCFQQYPSRRQWHHTSAPPQQQSAQSGVIETFTDNLQGNDD